MPWTPADAKRHTKKATTPRLQRMWADTANGVLRKTGDDALAVREANGVIAKRTVGGGTKPKKR